MWAILVANNPMQMSAFPKTHKKARKTFAENSSNDYLFHYKMNLFIRLLRKRPLAAFLGIGQFLPLTPPFLRVCLSKYFARRGRGLNPVTSTSGKQVQLFPVNIRHLSQKRVAKAFNKLVIYALNSLSFSCHVP